MSNSEITLDQFKQAGKKFLDALKDPALTGSQARDGFREFCEAYIACNVENDARAKTEAPIVYHIIAKEWLAYAGPKNLLF